MGGGVRERVFQRRWSQETKSFPIDPKPGMLLSVDVEVTWHGCRLLGSPLSAALLCVGPDYRRKRWSLLL